jgi:hypothetical protein
MLEEVEEISWHPWERALKNFHSLNRLPSKNREGAYELRFQKDSLPGRSFYFFT